MCDVVIIKSSDGVEFDVSDMPDVMVKKLVESGNYKILNNEKGDNE